MLTLYVPSWSMRCPSAFLSDGDLAIIAATSDPVIAGAAGAPAGACPRWAQIANVSNVTKLVAAIIRITMQPPLVPYVQRRYGKRHQLNFIPTRKVRSSRPSRPVLRMPKASIKPPVLTLLVVLVALPIPDPGFE